LSDLCAKKRLFQGKKTEKVRKKLRSAAQLLAHLAVWLLQ
jgi:hypothetical protein